MNPGAIALRVMPAPIQSAVESLKKAASGDDVNAIRQAMSNLQSAAHAMAEHLYKQQSGPGGAAGGAGGTGGQSDQPTGDGKKEDVIDAEFEVKR